MYRYELEDASECEQVVKAQRLVTLERVRGRFHFEELLELLEVAAERVDEFGFDRVFHDRVALIGDCFDVLRDYGVVHPCRLLSGAMALYALGDIVPQIDPEAFVHPEATIIGNVVIGAGATVWPQAVLRGDQSRIVVGARTSVQDGAVLHCTRDLETLVGADCTIGHLAHLEGCIVEDGALVGTGSIVLHRAIVRTGALVGAGAVVPGGMEVPAGAMARGVPAKLKLDALDPSQITHPAREYQKNWARYRAEMRRID